MALRLSFRFYDLPLRHAFTISRYTVNIQKTMIVTISDGIFAGYGEATVNPYYYSTEKKLSDSLVKIRIHVESAGDLHPEDFWKLISPHLQHDYFALCAIDIAYWDYFARKNGKPLRRYFSDKETAPLTSYTIGIDDIEVMKRKIIEMPWPVYKIKLGAGNDIQVIEALRKVTGSTFRVDANAAWNADQAIEYSKILKQFNVEFIEQPLPAADVEGMRKVKAASELPVVADESCQREEDVPGCTELFHGINIKLMKCGGITPALRMIAEARKRNLLLMAGCMTESTVGISALAQIAPFLDFLDADGALLLAEDLASGVRFDSGSIVWANGNGTGAELLRK